MPIGGAVGGVVTALNVNENLQQTLVNSTPDDLRIINRKKLFALGVTRENADEFLMHPWYSPWHETIITDALATIGVDPTQFLEKACRALTEQDANYFQSLAQVLARYHKTVGEHDICRGAFYTDGCPCSAYHPAYWTGSLRQ